MKAVFVATAAAKLVSKVKVMVFPFDPSDAVCNSGLIKSTAILIA